ncbi:MAG: FAD-dependent oxidoreductase, partial [Planctomycetota bacterium]|nr:FAD-dependent oxidoreductase [Planctomycetota bacterium]
RLWDLVQDHGGLVRGLRAAAKARRAAPGDPLPGPECRRSDLLSLRGGLGKLPAALASELEGQLQLNARAEEVRRTPGGFEVRLASGETHSAAQLVVALPARATAQVCAALLEELDLSLLAQLPHASVTVVHLGLDSAPLPEGFGFLVPPDETGADAPRALGVLFPSRQFEGRAPEGRDSITAIYRSDDLAGDDPVEVACEDLRRALGTRPNAPVHEVVRWNDVIPRYGVGHAPRAARLVAAARGRYPGLFLAGNWEGGVSVEDCLARGRRVAAALTGARITEAAR